MQDVGELRLAPSAAMGHTEVMDDQERLQARHAWMQAQRCMEKPETGMSRDWVVRVQVSLHHIHCRLGATSEGRLLCIGKIMAVCARHVHLVLCCRKFEVKRPVGARAEPQDNVASVIEALCCRIWSALASGFSAHGCRRTRRLGTRAGHKEAGGRAASAARSEGAKHANPGLAPSCATSWRRSHILLSQSGSSRRGSSLESS